MNKIKIITDTTVDLLPEIYEKEDIDVLPLYVTIGGKTYSDGEDITPAKLFKLVEVTGDFPKTSNQNEYHFEQTFRKWLDQGYDCFYIGLGSHISATYANATAAAKEIGSDRIRIVDSQSLSSGAGLLVLKAAKYVREGCTLDEVARKVSALVPNVRVSFSVDTLSYLHRGGRCSGTARIIGTLLHLHPIIKVVNGDMLVAQKPMGMYRRALNAQLAYIRADQARVDPDAIMVTHCEAHEDALYLMDELKTMFPGVPVIETFASCTISTHCGPRTIGILYIVNP